MVVFGLGRTTKVLLVLCLLGTATLVLSEGTERYFWHNEVRILHSGIQLGREKDLNSKIHRPTN